LNVVFAQKVVCVKSAEENIANGVKQKMIGYLLNNKILK